MSRSVTVLPIITKVIFSHMRFDSPSTNVAQRHASPAQKNVAQKSHFCPIRPIMKIAIAIAGISTSPARACEMNRKSSLVIVPACHNVVVRLRHQIDSAILSHSHMSFFMGALKAPLLLYFSRCLCPPCELGLIPQMRILSKAYCE